MEKLKKDRLLGIIVLVIAAFFAYFTGKLGSTNFEGDPGPKMFPYMGSIIMALCGIILLVKPEKKEKGKFLSRDELKHAALLFGIYVLFVVMMKYLGFVVTAPIVLFVVSFLFSKISDPGATARARVIRSLIYSVAVTAALYLVYVVALDAKLPSGALLKLFR